MLIYIRKCISDKNWEGNFWYGWDKKYILISEINIVTSDN